MIQGVHAETIVFSSYEQARGYVLARNLHSVGIASQFGGREVELRGTRPRLFRARVAGVNERAKTISCQLELHDLARLYAPLMRVELSFVADGANTRISLRGSAARDLTPAASMQAPVARGLANEYARAFLDKIAEAIEKRSADNRGAIRRPSKEAARQKRS